MCDEIVVIEKGSLVVLKSGSPAMEVTAVGEDGIGHCVWENTAGELVEEDHPVSALALYTGENARPENQPL